MVQRQKPIFWNHSGKQRRRCHQSVSVFYTQARACHFVQALFIPLPFSWSFCFTEGREGTGDWRSAGKNNRLLFLRQAEKTCLTPEVAGSNRPHLYISHAAAVSANSLCTLDKLDFYLLVIELFSSEILTTHHIFPVLSKDKRNGKCSRFL